MYKEKMIIDEVKWFAKYTIDYIEKTQTEEIDPFDEGYKAALTHVLEKIEKYEKETNNNK